CAHGGTRRMVQSVKARASRLPDIYETVFLGIGELVEKARCALGQGDYETLGELMDVNQGYLNALGVSEPSTEMLCDVARTHGALGAKLTGAGGGGAVIALCNGNSEAVLEGFRQRGIKAF